MGLVDPDPLAVLPVRAASASAAFARACDPRRDRAERREHLRSLELILTAVRELLRRCEQEAARLAAEVDDLDPATPCAGHERVCSHCHGAPGECSDAAVCDRGLGNECHKGGVRCGRPAAVTLREPIGVQQTLCLPHAAAAVRQLDPLVVVAASRSSRAVLAEAAGESCVVSRHRRLLADVQERGRGA